MPSQHAAEGPWCSTFAQGCPIRLRQSRVVPPCTHCLPALPPVLREAEIRKREEGKDRTKRKVPRRKTRSPWRVLHPPWKGAKEENMLKLGALPCSPTPQDIVSSSQGLSIEEAALSEASLRNASFWPMRGKQLC